MLVDSVGLLGLGTVSVSVLLSSVDVSEMSHSTGTSGVSSDGLGGPSVSSLGGTATEGSGLLLLEMEVGFSTNSGDSVRVSVSFTSGWGTSRHFSNIRI